MPGANNSPGGDDVDIEARLDALERSGRRWRAASVGLGLALAGVVMVGAARGTGEVRANRFVLVDSAGSVRATWETDPDESSGIDFYNRDGQLKLSAGVGKDDLPAVTFYRGFGRGRQDWFPDMEFRTDYESGGHVRFFGQKGRPTLELPPSKP